MNKLLSSNSENVPCKKKKNCDLSNYSVPSDFDLTKAVITGVSGSPTLIQTV
jgi:hypothetical protein